MMMKFSGVPFKITKEDGTAELRTFDICESDGISELYEGEALVARLTREDKEELLAGRSVCYQGGKISFTEDQMETTKRFSEVLERINQLLSGMSGGAPSPFEPPKPKKKEYLQ